jgi:hypothetical protein
MGAGIERIDSCARGEVLNLLPDTGATRRPGRVIHSAVARRGGVASDADWLDKVIHACPIMRGRIIISVEAWTPDGLHRRHASRRQCVSLPFSAAIARCAHSEPL